MQNGTGQYKRSSHSELGLPVVVVVIFGEMDAILHPL